MSGIIWVPDSIVRGRAQKLPIFLYKNHVLYFYSNVTSIYLKALSISTNAQVQTFILLLEKLFFSNSSSLITASIFVILRFTSSISSKRFAFKSLSVLDRKKFEGVKSGEYGARIFVGAIYCIAVYFKYQWCQFHIEVGSHLHTLDSVPASLQQCRL